MGKFLVILTIVASVLAGGGIYYTQIYAFYHTVPGNGRDDIRLTRRDSGLPEPVPYAGFEAIDADSSPIRYRACFTTSVDLQTLTDTYAPYDAPTPLTGPGWFGCYDAGAIGDALASGHARAFVGVENLHYGVDRVVAITDDGHGYVWHQLNDCGERAYDGSAVNPDCPEPPKRN